MNQSVSNTILQNTIASMPNYIRELIPLLAEKNVFVSERDPRRNTAFIGIYQVAEPASNDEDFSTTSGPRFCVVGNDLALLIEHAASTYLE